MVNNIEFKYNFNDLFIDIKNANCFNKLKEIQKESIHLVLTDPPYFLDGLDGNWAKGKNAKNERGVIKNMPSGMKFDKRQGTKLQQYIFNLGSLIIELMKPGAFALFFSQPRLSHRMAIGLEDAGFEIRDMYTWHFKNQSQFKAFSMDHFIEKKNISREEKDKILYEIDGRKTAQLKPNFETIIMCQKPKQGTLVENWLKYETGLIDTRVVEYGNAPSTVMNFDKEKRSKINTHPTVKPTNLIMFLIQTFSKKGQTVLDPFLGSGTTALACKYTHRSCIGFEIDQEYFDIIQKRFDQSFGTDMFGENINSSSYMSKR